MVERVSASGERAAIAGYLPQFDEFAWFVYLNLINGKLEWIRVADPKAEKLDDIQFSTHSELHAYQVKWTIANATISFSNFIELLPQITDSWKSLTVNNSNKKVIPHLITNKPISSQDSLKQGNTKIGSFKTFIDEVWIKLKANQKVDAKWNSIIANFKKLTKLDDTQFDEFVSVFDFQHSYERRRFSVEKVLFSREDRDLIDLSRLLWEQAGSEERNIEFSRDNIIDRVGWRDRFKTVFNHELIINRQSYQPIQSTIDLLNYKLSEHKSGYLFLQGSPGSGKSTLLNQWSKGLKARIVWYYAFDFVNPSSHLNISERGNATNLYFDLVFQLKEVGIYKRDILPVKDLLFLKDVFHDQLNSLGQDFAKTGQPTIIIIDGLDHVPREYKLTTDSFLRALPLSSSLPDGVFIILGSQSFILEDIPLEIRTEFQLGARTIRIDSLNKAAVYTYISKVDSSEKLTDAQKLLIFEKSQGHPLYLSYFIEKINHSESIEDVINSFETIDGSIENYYTKIWNPIQNDVELIRLLGYICRVNGSIKLLFIKEWNFGDRVEKLFYEKAKVLFHENDKTLSFFHNSFKLFLLYHTSKDFLSNEYDESKNISYHIQLADYYLRSKVENSWKQNHHLFQAHQYKKFIREVTPASFTAQLLDFRPVEEIKQDIKLGIEIARNTRDINTLVKYLFALAEIERRHFNIDPATFTHEYLILGKSNIASDYLRTGNVLHCSNTFALKAARLFIQFSLKSEGSALFNLAYPAIISDSGISIDNSNKFDEIRDTLNEWIKTAPYFETITDILSKIDNLKISKNIHSNRFDENESDLQMRLISNLGHALIEQNRWDDLILVLTKIDKIKDENTLFNLMYASVEKCWNLKDTNRANEYLTLLTTQFPIEKTNSIAKIYIADLLYKVTHNIDETTSWLNDIDQPIVTQDNIDYYGSFEPFIPIIKFNKLLTICGKGVSITKAIPYVTKKTDDEIFVEFQRMLCLTSNILAEGIIQSPASGDILKRVVPIIKFYYKSEHHSHSYWYKLIYAKEKYFDFLIYAVSKHGVEKIESLANYLFKEFALHPKFWNPDSKRNVIESLIKIGFISPIIKEQLISLEKSMLENLDIDGRINECISQAKVWLNLNELEIAEKWLKHSIQESIGIGYRKDYQFTTWIKWLKKINLKDPSGSTERIKWFLSHLKHIKETTEGSAYSYASEEILDATYEHNLNDGLEQTIWQLENDLVDFCDAIALFIKYFIIQVKNENELKNIIPFFNSLYLNLVESPDPDLLKLILEKGYELLQIRFLEKYLNIIISAINIKTIEENRRFLLSEIEKFCSIKGMKVNDFYSNFEIRETIQKSDSSQSSNILMRKKNQQRIDEKEVLKLVSNFDDLKKLIQEEDQQNSNFNWSHIISKITYSLTSSQINEVANFAKVGKGESDFFAELSQLAMNIDDMELAESLANKSIEMSSQSGWIKYYDGGTRIKAFNALRKVKPDQSIEKAFDVFTHDVVSGTYTGSYIEHLDEIIPFLVQNYNEEEIWKEVFDYLQRLMSNSKPAKNLPLLLSIEKPISETLVDYLLYLAKNPVTLVQEESILLLAMYINQNNSFDLANMLTVKMNEYTALDVVMTLRELNSPKIIEVKSILQNFALSKDYLLRESAKQILKDLGETIPVVKKIDLPSIYSLHFPDPKIFETKTKNAISFSDFDNSNPRDLIHPYEFLIHTLSKVSGIDESNLFYRTHSIMKEIGNKEDWTVEGETKLKHHLEQTNLKFRYRTPKNITAYRAIMHVTSELFDSGTVDNKIFPDIFTLPDYSVYHFNEIPKPDFIQVIKEKEFGGVSKDWLERINESKRLNEPILSYNKNYKIIAEYCQIKNLDWGAPIEEYMYQISVKDAINEGKINIFGSVFDSLSYNYHAIGEAGPFIIVIRDLIVNQFNLKSTWIAINPILARNLRWVPDLSRLFAWKNSSGELMAESIYWSNGNIQMQPRKDAEVGEGWFVVVSDDALKQIKSIAQNLYLQKKIVRAKREASQLLFNEHFSSTKL